MDERRIKPLEVEFPSEGEMLRQTNEILNLSMPKRKSLPDKIRFICQQPGLGVIFYHCSSAWLVTALVYVIMYIACQAVKAVADSRSGVLLMAYPVCYLTFSFVSCWLEEQEEIVELKNTMHYSNIYLVSLRMFYSGIVMMGGNLLLLLSCNSYYTRQEMWKLGASGVSSMFLFATASLYLYHKIQSSRYFATLMVVWIVLCCMLMRLGTLFDALVFGTLPLTLHIAVAVCCFLCFVIYIRKVEKENAYAFTY